ncbi:MAG: coenzyme F420 biosynthesis-associated protein [Actinobacteria bacterium 69-20]|nr:zinc-dependent metalloprotease [Actinomycetota bacterium]OJV23553.1 MAG: coenzyme F420 biosynthesis-associated protein [Actinobacteria bacterium 69-20]
MTANPIDWDAAVRAGQRLAPRGPRVTPSEARAVVKDLRSFATVAEGRVRETTGLGLDLPIADAEVLDRRGWIAASAEGMALLTKPLTDRLGATEFGAVEFGATAAGSQVGILLGYLSGRVLGQYDPVGGQREPSEHSGRLLLVAPNVVKVEREIGAAPADFRLWVCLHESTHRLQFTAVPWMADYFRSLVADYASVAPTDSAEVLRRIGSVITGRGDTAREAPGTVGDSWLRRIQTPEQQRVFDSVMALMTLLEGHADYVMDAVGPAVVPSVDEIRAAFTERRRKGRGPLDRMIRSLLGMDAKLAQYARGAAFVRVVVERVGMARFNEVFTSPDTLPTVREIDDAPAWIGRVLG